jgi:uncharacterized protein YidB (DUF937 family)
VFKVKSEELQKFPQAHLYANENGFIRLWTANAGAIQKCFDDLIDELLTKGSSGSSSNSGGAEDNVSDLIARVEGCIQALLMEHEKEAHGKKKETKDSIDPKKIKSAILEILHPTLVSRKIDEQQFSELIEKCIQTQLANLHKHKHSK